MAIVGPYLSVITLNVNGSNATIKRHRVAVWKRETILNDMLPTRDSLQFQVYTHRLKKKVWGEMFHTNGNQEKAEVAILISDKIKTLRQQW